MPYLRSFAKDPTPGNGMTLVHQRGSGAAAALTGLRSVTTLWLITAQVATEGRQIRKHDYGNVLRNVGLATAPQQASATFFFVHCTAELLRRKPNPVCRQSKLQDSQRVLRRGSCFHGLLPPLRNKQQASGM